MSFVGVLFFTIVQLIFFSGLILIWMRMKKDYSDDSRWSRNLQILQSKIAVFEDLSDRAEVQVNQLTIMLENKMCDMQRKIDEADEILNKISSAMKKSMEVAQIFQDKIPHEEIIERQNTVKFVRAALMAHEGKSEDEIAEIVNLPKSQIEFIVKVNSQRLSFDPGQMPEWLKTEVIRGDGAAMTGGASSSSMPFARSPLRPLNQLLRQNLAFIGDEAQNQSLDNSSPSLSTEIINLATAALNASSGKSGGESSTLESSASKAIPTIGGMASGESKRSFIETKKIKDIGIRPVVFPRIEMPPKN